MKPTYLITGGCGFIGSHLADHLIEHGFDVRILDDLSTGKKRYSPPKAELIPGSITDKKTLQHALRGVQGVFHLAALVSIEKSIHQWSDSHRTNLLATIELFEYLAQKKNHIPVVYASSSAVYGQPEKIPLTESAPLHPLSPYGADKMGSEQHAFFAWKFHQIPSVGFRFFNVYGPRQDPSSPYSGVISIFVDKICKKEPITIYGSGEQQRDFVHVHDVVRFLAKAMSSEMKDALIFNICTGKGTSINQLAHQIGEIAKQPVIKEYAPPRSGDVMVSIGDVSKAAAYYGLKPEIDLHAGLIDLIKEKQVF